MITYEKLWETMKQKGITKYRLHKDYHFSKSLIHRLSKNEGVTIHTINTLCELLNCKVEDILTYRKE